MFNIPKNLENYGKWYDENLYPFNIDEISNYYLKHKKLDGTIDVSKFSSTFDKNEISHFNNAVIVRQWYEDLNKKINLMFGCIFLYSVGKLVYTIYKYKKNNKKNN